MKEKESDNDLFAESHPVYLQLNDLFDVYNNKLKDNIKRICKDLIKLKI